MTDMMLFMDGFDDCIVAEDFFYFNQANCWMGNATPCFLNRNENLREDAEKGEV